MKSEERVVRFVCVKSKSQIILMLALAMSLCACEFVDMRRQHVDERVRMHAGSSWQFGALPNATPEITAIMKRYFEGKEVFLMPGSIKVIDTDLEVELHLYNKWLTCEPPFPNQGLRWSCRPPELETVAVGDDAELGECVKRASGGALSPNFVGVIEKGYCIYINVMEFKELVDKEPIAATNIVHDTLFIRVTASSGPVAPGVIRGGPRPQFRAPTVD